MLHYSLSQILRLLVGFFAAAVFVLFAGATGTRVVAPYFPITLREGEAAELR